MRTLLDHRDETPPGSVEPRFAHVTFVGERQGFTPSRHRGARVASAPALKALAPPAEETLEFFRWMCARGGIDATRYRASIFRRREGACLRALRANDLERARAILERRPEELERAMGALLIGVTQFFRDPLVFQSLASWIPALRRGRRALRVLSLGCSRGSELYSVGMLLGEGSCLASSHLLGVDCRPRAVQAAREGTYAPEELQGLSVERAKRWLAPCPRGMRVHASLAAACTFEVGNALDATRALPEHDLILCRNLAIYLAPEAAEELWTRVAKALRPGGLLVTGKAERPRVQGMAPAGACIYRRIP